MKQEKTIEDYRRDIKLLKLKYLKLSEEKTQLEQTVQRLASGHGTTSGAQIGDFASASDSPSKNSANYMSHDKNVMREFSMRCKQALGITPESLFRAADIEGAGVITDQQFKSFLLQSKLNLSAQHIQRILQLSDASCTGMIKRNQYFECLSAFQINQESNSTSVDKSSNRTFVQKSLVKFAANLVSLKMSPHDCFSTMDSGNESIVYYDDLNSFVAKYCKDMNETECIGAFNYLDIDKEQRIGRDMFVVEMKKVMRVVSKEKNINIDTFIDSRSSRPPKPQGPSGSSSQQLPNRRNSETAEPQSENQFSAAPVTIQLLTEKESQEILTKVQQTYKIDLENFLNHLIATTSHPTSGIFLTDFFKVFEKMKVARKIPNELKMKFFRSIDMGNNGSIDYEELISFYVDRKSNQHPIVLVYRLVARILQSISIRSEEAFSFLNVQRETILDEKNFKSVSEKIFFVTQPRLISKLFKELTGGKDKIIADVFIEEIDKELNNLQEVDLLNQSGLSRSSGGKVNRSKTRKPSNASGEKLKAGSQSKLNTKILKVETDISKYESIMKEIYPKFNKEKDFFEKVTSSHMLGIISGLKNVIIDFKYDQVVKNDDGEVQFTQWETILNDELPTLKKALEIVKQLEESGSMWKDPDFGPNDKDPFGSKSMYFSDNDVPSGCPPPENVTWMRIQEILDHHLENNPPEEGDEVTDDAHFLLAGASANDVQQSSYLGDCWFVSALSIIAQKDSYIIGSFNPDNKDVSTEQFMLQMSEGIYPPMFHFLHKYGIFVLKFYKNFEWRYVFIDDRLPCLDGKIIYSHCRKPNEFWVALIEKAYAKIHNCYQALTSGDIGQGLTDLTGQVSMKMRFESMMKVTREQVESGEFDKTGIQINGVKFNCSEENYEEIYQKLVRQRDKFWSTLQTFIQNGIIHYVLPDKP